MYISCLLLSYFNFKIEDLRIFCNQRCHTYLPNYVPYTLCYNTVYNTVYFFVMILLNFHHNSDLKNLTFANLYAEENMFTLIFGPRFSCSSLASKFIPLYRVVMYIIYGLKTYMCHMAKLVPLYLVMLRYPQY